MIPMFVFTKYLQLSHIISFKYTRFLDETILIWVFTFRILNQHYTNINQIKNICLRLT